MTFHGATYPFWLVALLCAGALAYAIAFGMYALRREIPLRMYAPAALAALGSCAAIAIFGFTQNSLWLLVSGWCSIGVFWTVRRISAYRWKNGGEERFRKRTDEMRAKIAQRRAAK